MKRFTAITPFNVPMKLLIPDTVMVKGTKQKIYGDPENAPLIFGNFRTFGGSETTQNDLYTVIDTGTVETWYRPDIKSDCHLYMCETGLTYEIKGRPENILMQNQFLRIRVQCLGGDP